MIDIKEIWIESENSSSLGWDSDDDNTDVIVTLEDQRKFVATFFTYKNIQSLVVKNRQTGECMKGKYFWASDMILIDTSSRKSIEEVIEHLINNNEFELIFKEIKRENTM